MAAEPSRLAAATASSLLLLLLLLGSASAQNSTIQISSSTHEIQVGNNATLHATVWQPSAGAKGLPLLVMPSSWGFGEVIYQMRAPIIAQRGYVVVGYAPRGFSGPDGGYIDVAGPDDVDDLSRVITWSLKETGADSGGVGVGGVSYGAGIALLGACHDERIKAVLSLSGWGDLFASLYANNTQHSQAVWMLRQVASPLGRFGEEMNSMLNALNTSNQAVLWDWARPRSPTACVDKINERGIASFLSTSWRDSIFPINQNVDLFERLTVPKRLEVRYGDHASSEFPGLFGLDSDLWDDAEEWLDVHLKRESSWIADAPAVQLLPERGAAYETYESWAAASNSTTVLQLSSPSPLTGSLTVAGSTFSLQAQQLLAEYAESAEITLSGQTTSDVSRAFTPFLSGGNLQAASTPSNSAGGGPSEKGVPAPAPEEPPLSSSLLASDSLPGSDAWSVDLQTGLQSEASAGVVELTNQVSALTGTPPTISLVETARSGAALVWNSEPFRNGLVIRGIPALQLVLSGTAPNGTFIAYLYDSGGLLGHASLITHGAFSFIDQPVGLPIPLVFQTKAALYDIPPGHSLALVVASQDDQYTSHNPRGSVLTFASSPIFPGALVLPTRG